NQSKKGGNNIVNKATTKKETEGSQQVKGVFSNSELHSQKGARVTGQGVLDSKRMPPIDKAKNKSKVKPLPVQKVNTGISEDEIAMLYSAIVNAKTLKELLTIEEIVKGYIEQLRTRNDAQSKKEKSALTKLIL